MGEDEGRRRLGEERHRRLARQATPLAAREAGPAQWSLVSLDQDSEICVSVVVSLCLCVFCDWWLVGRWEVLPGMCVWSGSGRCTCVEPEGPCVSRRHRAGETVPSRASTIMSAF